MCIVQRYTILYINCWSVMHLHFCESRSVHSSAVRPLFCPNKSIWSWKQFCQFCQPRHFTSGVRSITTCSLSSAPQMTNRWIFVCSSANTSILFKAFGCLLLQLAFSTVPSFLPVSTMRGTLLAASRRWVGGGWGLPGRGLGCPGKQTSFLLVTIGFQASEAPQSKQPICFAKVV